MPPSADEPEASLSSDQQRAIEALAKLMLDVYTHNDRLIWGQVRTLAVVQAGTLAAIYSIKSAPITVLAGLIGAIITVGIFLFTVKVTLERDINTNTFFFLTSTIAKRLPGDFFESIPEISGVVWPEFDISQPVRLHFPVEEGKEYIPVHILAFGATWKMPIVKLSAILNIAFVSFVILDVLAIIVVPWLRP